MRIMGICGSLRSAAYSLTVLEALRAAAPPSIDMSICRLHDIPMFDPDHSDAQNELPSLKGFRQAIDPGGAPVEVATGKALEVFMLAVRDWVASSQ